MASWSKVARRIRVPLGFALAVVYFWLAQPTLRSMLIGGALVLPGLLVRAIASGHVQKNEQLATSGPYAYTRNPLYLGSFILALGFACAARSLRIAALMAIMFFLIYLPVIRDEENFLLNHFPEFEDYAKRVPRLFPRLRGSQGGGSRFSWALYWKHREYNALLGSAVLLLALAAKLHWMSR
ncbi:MAG TPA: isoprenylcysteine carboxylmethyltransferase family protein [Terriglobales bacterium]|nr:isoprenylcysteine carboxylmethyltransferase family protein [Terriglobales bacterium]